MKHGYRALFIAVLPLALAPLILAATTALDRSADAIDYASPAIQETRNELDLPVENDRADRTWLWGPKPISDGVAEPYEQAPGGERLVQYFDKARFEITDPDAAADSDWYVTTGLLVREMITGKVQVGDNSYESHTPAQIPMAGDPNNTWPTYGGFASAIDRPYADNTGQHVTNVLLANGVTRHEEAADDPGTEVVQYVSYQIPSGTVGYNIPRAFWNFMNASGVRWNGNSYVESDPLFDWRFVMGYPISDPFWVSVLLDGEPAWVMIQPFERRVLTYTPSNEPAWRVEMGNVGSHYLRWRYPEEEEPPATPTATPNPSPSPTSSPAPTSKPTRTPQPTDTPPPAATSTATPEPAAVPGGEFFAMNPGSQ